MWGKHVQAKLKPGWFKRGFFRKVNALLHASGACVRETQADLEIFIFKNVKAEFDVIVLW